MDTVNTFATFITNLGTLALIAVAILGVMRVIGWAIQSRVQRHRTAALTAEYGAGIAGKPMTPPSDKRHYRRAA